MKLDSKGVTSDLSLVYYSLPQVVCRNLQIPISIYLTDLRIIV